MRAAARRLEIRRGAWVASDELRSTRDGVEIIAPTDADEEYMHLDVAGRLVHRVSGARSLLARLLGPVSRIRAFSGWFFALRAMEKIVELELLFGRHWNEVSATDPRVRMLLPLIRLPTFPREEIDRRVGPDDDGVRSADLVCCTDDRVDALVEALSSLVREAKRAGAAGIPCRVRVVHQKETTPARVLERRPSLKRSVEFIRSSGGLNRARNLGLAHSTADLVIFVEDGGRLDEGFVLEHVQAAERFPRAVGVAGRVESRAAADRIVRTRAVGQLRPSGDIDAGFNSDFDGVPLVPFTPHRANMAFRRRRVNSLLGPAWFDEANDGAAHLEETTVALELFRRGAHLVFAPRASLQLDAPANDGRRGRENRELSLDYLFLNRLYSHDRLLRALGPLGLLARDVLRGDADRPRTELLRLHARGYLDGNVLYTRSK